VTLQYNREIQQNLSITLCGLPMRITISFWTTVCNFIITDEW
jgi:hypothetical protein